MDPLIELTDVAFGYESFNVLEGIDLHLHPGQFVGLVGPSGAGKTSLLKLVLELNKPNAGRIERVRPDLRMTYVPQIETVDWSFPVTAEEVVLMGLDHRKNVWPWPPKTRLYRAMQMVYSGNATRWPNRRAASERDAPPAPPSVNCSSSNRSTSHARTIPWKQRRPQPL